MSESDETLFQGVPAGARLWVQYSERTSINWMSRSNVGCDQTLAAVQALLGQVCPLGTTADLYYQDPKTLNLTRVARVTYCSWEIFDV